jgi:hypothetical protein
MAGAALLARPCLIVVSDDEIERVFAAALSPRETYPDSDAGSGVVLRTRTPDDALHGPGPHDVLAR